jgi:aconitase A
VVLMPDDKTLALYMDNRKRVRDVIEGLRLFWPYDDLKEVRYMYGHGELAEAISLACAYARKNGFGTVQDEMLALADQFGEHDFTAFSPHPYMRIPEVPQDVSPVEEVASSVREDAADQSGTDGGEYPPETAS